VFAQFLLPAGATGAICGPPGVGKSALLIEFALEALLTGQSVLHLCSSTSVEEVRAAYDELLSARLRRSGQASETALVDAPADKRWVEGASGTPGLAERVNRKRVIEVFGHAPTAADAAAALAVVREELGLHPGLVVVDPVASDRRLLEEFSTVAREAGCAVWFSLARDAHGQQGSIGETAALVDTLIELEAHASRVDLYLVRRGGEAIVPPRVVVLHDFGHGVLTPAPQQGASGLVAGACVLYSGGAMGSEEAFGQAAEAWGVQEVNFTFEGHNPARMRGAVKLSDAEMNAGDVSLLYVSRRMNRTYTDGSRVRRVLQSLWHQVRHAGVTFVVGVIRDDDTVMGGTGWAVELARTWNKPVWVFDQEESRWYRWSADGWKEDVPVIDTPHFAGTGTRHLTDAARTAIYELFERSFGPRAKS
jgi:KaiC/GvpD/RAD55 family RecA-like ATPase